MIDISSEVKVIMIFVFSALELAQKNIFYEMAIFAVDLYYYYSDIYGTFLHKMRLTDLKFPDFLQSVNNRYFVNLAFILKQ